MAWPEWLNRLADRVGRKGAILGALGVCWIAAGFEEWLDQPPAAMSPAWVAPHEWLPPWLRLALWTATGATMFVASWWRTMQPAGWGAAVIAPLMHAVSYMWAVLMAFVPGGPPGRLTVLPDAVAWSCVSVVVTWLASWPTIPHAPRAKSGGR